MLRFSIGFRDGLIEMYLHRIKPIDCTDIKIKNAWSKQLSLIIAHKKTIIS